MNKAHLTAISRTTVSTPSMFLFLKDFLQGRVLDYGCGKGMDVKFLGLMGTEVEGYDPYYQPVKPQGEFDTVYCNFVLNVIEDASERKKVLENIQNCLKLGGTAYISVRNDKKKLKGKTSKGTWQGYIELDLPVVHKTANYVMYKLSK